MVRHRYTVLGKVRGIDLTALAFRWLLEVNLALFRIFFSVLDSCQRRSELGGTETVKVPVADRWALPPLHGSRPRPIGQYPISLDGIVQRR